MRGGGGQPPFDMDAAEISTLPAEASDFVFVSMLQGCNNYGACNHGHKSEGHQ
jgi:hypothetical protein